MYARSSLKNGFWTFYHLCSGLLRLSVTRTQEVELCSEARPCRPIFLLILVTAFGGRPKPELCFLLRVSGKVHHKSEKLNHEFENLLVKITAMGRFFLCVTFSIMKYKSKIQFASSTIIEGVVAFGKYAHHKKHVAKL